MEKLKKHLSILKNPNTGKKGDFTFHILNEANGDYLLLDNDTNDWFPVHEQIPELLRTELLYPETLQFFKENYMNEIQSLDLSFPLLDKETNPQITQREHYDAFSEDENMSYDDFEQLPFWIAVDEVVYEYFAVANEEECFVLDLGCGNGRSIKRFIPQNATVIGLDISRKMLKKAINRPQASNSLLMVGDGSNPPFVGNCFDYCVTSGVLSNFPDSKATCQSIHNMLKMGGTHLGLENNKSIFRLPFDILNKFTSIWKNVKGKDPEMNQGTLENWYSGKKVSVISKTLVFLPPQFFSRTSVEEVQTRIKKTDKFFKAMGMSRQGGLIVFKAKKI
jgi:ubiquinone/menaquinone biosynthesis C-methylase UbiE